MHMFCQYTLSVQRPGGWKVHKITIDAAVLYYTAEGGSLRNTACMALGMRENHI